MRGLFGGCKHFQVERESQVKQETCTAGKPLSIVQKEVPLSFRPSKRLNRTLPPRRAALPRRFIYPELLIRAEDRPDQQVGQRSKRPVAPSPAESATRKQQATYAPLPTACSGIVDLPESLQLCAPFVPQAAHAVWAAAAANVWRRIYIPLPCIYLYSLQRGSARAR